MANNNQGTYTSAQKKVCSRLKAYYAVCSQICESRGDVLSQRAYRYLSETLDTMMQKGPEYLEDLISRRKQTLEAYQKDEY